MNILPLIIGFIVIFSCLSWTFLKEAQAISIVERSIDAAFRVETQLQSSLSRRSYLRKARVRNPTPKGEKRIRPYYSLRAFSPPIEESKLNIAPLLDKAINNVHEHPLYPIAAKLIWTLYKKSPAIPNREEERWEEILLDALIAKGRSLPAVRHLSDLFPDDPNLHKTFYKMLKGTNQYSLVQGIAPFGNFFTLDSSAQARAIHFCFASPQLLEALFGQEITEKLLNEEKKQWENTGKTHFSSKEDLQALLLKDMTLTNLLGQLEPHLSFHKKIPPKSQIAGKDRITGLVITREI